MFRKIKSAATLVAMTSVALLIAGCSSGGQVPVASEPDTVTVKFGILPYDDWMPWVAAQNLGYMEEVGVKLEFIKFSDDIKVATALENGDVDIASTNSASGPLTFSRFPDLRTFHITNAFRGYAIMVRPDDVYPKGKIKTYDQLFEEQKANGLDEEAAREEAIKLATSQLKGKTLVMDTATGSNLPLQAALKAGGLSESDVNYINIKDTEGALAFWGGTGDFELGGFPQVMSLGKLGAQKLISAAELGGTSVIVSGQSARAEWLASNEKTVSNMLTAWYQIIEDMYSDPAVRTAVADAVNEYGGGQQTAEDVQKTMEGIMFWPKQDEVRSYFLDDDATSNVDEVYEASLAYWVDTAEQVDAGSVDIAKSMVFREYFDRIGAATK
jgi:ABC-type nitrate/sulfonate/bicarbonate transport system substrate-binding protein